MDPPLKIDDSPPLKPASTTEFFCRICFDAESDGHSLISPCKCNGSMRYIHEECLKIWLLSRDKDLSTSECDICKEKFKMSILLATKCTCKNYWSECLGMFIFPILLVLMASILMVILLFLVDGIESGHSSAGEQTYLILLVIACTVIIVIILIIFIKSIKKGCCSAEMVSWHIESVPQAEALEDTIEQGISSQTQNVEEVQVMVMPKVHRINGMNLIRPEILTPRLVPIMRGDELVGYRSKPCTARSLAASQSFSFQKIPQIAVDRSENFHSKVQPMDLDQSWN
jgi:hypothetical protein